MARRSPRPAPPAPTVRTCVGCRTRAAKSELLRVVSQDGVVVPDPRARLPGRGAYLHPSQKCFEQAFRRQVFGRALRVPGLPAVTGLEEYLAGRCGEPDDSSSGDRGPGQRR